MTKEKETKALAWMEAKADEETGLVEGYGATYKVDAYGDKILPGAFEKTIKAKDGKVPLLVNHFIDTWAGTTLSLVENDKGLRVAGKLFLDTTAGRDMFGLLKNAAAAEVRVGLSIGFIAVDTDFEEDVRIIKQIDLWEISFTPFPAQQRAFVTGVKSTVREAERHLRDAGRLSRVDAKRIIAEVVTRAKPPLPSGTLGGSDRNARLLAAMKRK